MWVAFLWYIKSIIYFTAQNMRIQLIILAVAFLLSIAPAKAEKHQAIHGFKPPASHQLSVIPNNAFVVFNCPLHAKTPEWFTISLNKYNSSCREQYLLSAIIYYESKFNANAQNSSSSAAGLAQYLDSTWARHGCNKYGGRTSIDAHIQCALFDLRRNLGKQWAVWPLVNNNKYGYRI